jgi:hypothetical protein
VNGTDAELARLLAELTIPPAELDRLLAELGSSDLDQLLADLGTDLSELPAHAIPGDDDPLMTEAAAALGLL